MQLRTLLLRGYPAETAAGTAVVAHACAATTVCTDAEVPPALAFATFAAATYFDTAAALAK